MNPAEVFCIWSCDAQSWRRLEPNLVEVGGDTELYRSKKMGVYEHTPRDVMSPATPSKYVGPGEHGGEEHTEVRCRRVAKRLGSES